MKKQMKRGDYIHKEYPKTKAENDFWGQVCRTVNGVAVSQDQIDMIVSVIKRELQIRKEDVLLDIGCGNGALSNYFFNILSGFHGVDFSGYLIKIAKKYFENPPKYIFTEEDGVEFVLSAKDKSRFTKALCYGAFMYFSYDNALTLLRALNQHYPNLNRIFLGNMPDKDKSDLFFKDKPYSSPLNDHLSATGIWRTKDEFKELAKKSQWDIFYSHMPGKFYASQYRYDVTLVRKKI